MTISDLDIIKRFKTNQNKLNSNWNRMIKDYEIEYIKHRFSDTSDCKEAIYRIIYNIIEIPICPICGNKVGWNGRCYQTCCSNQCSKILNGRKSNIGKRKNLIKQVIQEKYGVNNIFQLENIKEKIKQTKLEKYNDKYYSNRQQAKQTMIERFGANTYMTDETLKQQSLENRKNTCLEKYGVQNVFQNDNIKTKSKQTLLEHYGVENPGQIEELKSIRKLHEYQTKKKNNSFNISKLEDKSYKLLKNKYIDVVRQYSDDRYPFACDFYIPSLDLFIECNYHWTHGGKLFEDTEEDKQKLEKWKNKNTKYYNNAIKTWTDLDVRKQKIAKENKLNYLVFYNINKFNEWINKKEKLI